MIWFINTYQQECYRNGTSWWRRERVQSWLQRCEQQSVNDREASVSNRHECACVCHSFHTLDKGALLATNRNMVNVCVERVVVRKRGVFVNYEPWKKIGRANSGKCLGRTQQNYHAYTAFGSWHRVNGSVVIEGNVFAKHTNTTHSHISHNHTHALFTRSPLCH